MVFWRIFLHSHVDRMWDLSFSFFHVPETGLAPGPVIYALDPDVMASFSFALPCLPHTIVATEWHRSGDCLQMLLSTLKSLKLMK